ncbi:hypothetical protein C1701_26300 [Actinoalloteichus sp. AHMU CJ021]|uniref:hypothetical protein n=1 Tax=Actinoalloteichus sp. AHMU CJ021 TaxID=2072503 RepID=UPI000CA064D1|nr:hypothetical protein C1701_26300 [Actinoalloteichus sp. AHMU CJ021]
MAHARATGVLAVVAFDAGRSRWSPPSREARGSMVTAQRVPLLLGGRGLTLGRLGSRSRRGEGLASLVGYPRGW